MTVETEFVKQVDVTENVEETANNSIVESDDEDVLLERILHPIRKAKKSISKPDTAYLKAPKVIPGGAVVYVGRLPHGFYESELRAYLAQFGDITRLRISRNPRTGASRHYGFVEFRHAEVAAIVAETMHNYLVMGHLLQVVLMPEEKIHASLWKGADRKFVQIPWLSMEAKRYNNRLEKEIAPAMAEKKEETRQKRRQAKQAKCKALGLDYDFSSVLTGDLE